MGGRATWSDGQVGERKKREERRGTGRARLVSSRLVDGGGRLEERKTMKKGRKLGK